MKSSLIRSRPLLHNMTSPKPLPIFNSHIRSYSSYQPPTPPPKQVSPHISFYKVHGAPIAKVLLMATFVYQVAYWGWVKLEKDEEKANRSAEIEGLEQKLKGLVGETRGK